MQKPPFLPIKRSILGASRTARFFNPIERVFYRRTPSGQSSGVKEAGCQKYRHSGGGASLGGVGCLSLRGANASCHCEERSDEATSMQGQRLLHPLRGFAKTDAVLAVIARSPQGDAATLRWSELRSGTYLFWPPVSAFGYAATSRRPIWDPLPCQ